MMRSIKIYYGLSGTFKGTTISTLGLPVLETAIKGWKSYEAGIFSEKMNPSDLNFGALHLIRLQDFLKFTEGNIVIERGLSDCLFYYFNNDEYGKLPEFDVNFIKEALMEEEKILEGFEVTRELLIQKDSEFIKTHVLMEPHRNKTFRGSLEYYLEQQEKYIEFTKTYNKIDNVVEIINARDYIEGLGKDYEE